MKSPSLAYDGATTRGSDEYLMRMRFWKIRPSPMVSITCASWFSRLPITKRMNSQWTAIPSIRNTTNTAGTARNGSKPTPPANSAHERYMASIMKSAWAKFTTRITPKMSPRPDASSA